MNTRTRVSSVIGNATYKEAEGLPHGILPTKKHVIECMIYLLRPDRAGAAVRSREDAAEILAFALVDHWEYCNVYTVGFSVRKKEPGEAAS